MDKFISAIADVLLFFEYFSFFYVVLCRNFRKITRNEIISIIICILVWFCDLMWGFDENLFLLLPFSIIDVIAFIIVYTLFEVKPLHALAMSIGEYLLLSIIMISIMVPLEHISIDNNLKGLFQIVLMISIIWICYLFVCRNSKDGTLQLPTRMWWIIDVIMIVLMMMMSFFSYVIVDLIPNNNVFKVGRLLSIFGSSFIALLILILMYYYNLMQSVRAEKELVEMLNEQQRIYFKSLLEKEEETRNFRHDIINDLLEIKNYFEKQEYFKLKGYLDSTLGAIIDISRSSYDVGNDVVNTVLNYYLKPLKNKYYIEIEGYMGKCVFIDERDLCVIIANLIKNSAEAVCKMKRGAILFKVEQGKHYLSFIIKNTYDGKLTIDKTGEIITQKIDKINHGIGIRNVKEIVKKYEGEYKTDINDNMYCVKIILNIRDHSRRNMTVHDE